jgi:hypothetical protein
MRLLAVAAAVLAASACKKTSDRPPAPVPSSPSGSAALRAFATDLEKAMNPCDPQAIAELVDFETIGRKAVQDTTAAEAVIWTFLDATIREGPEKLCAEINGTNGDYRLVHVFEDRSTVVFRLRGPDGMNYHELAVGERDGRRARATDLYVFMSGEWLSDSYRSLLDQLRGRTPAPDFVGIHEDLAAGDIDGAQRRFDAIAEEIRDRKVAWSVRLEIASRRSEAAYIEVLEAYETRFPDDPSLDMVALDTLFYREDWAGLLRRVDRLDARIGGDPALEGMRALALGGLGRHADAIASARRAIDAEPDHQDAWGLLLAVQRDAADHAGALATFAEYDRRFAIRFEPEAIEADPLWAKLIASAEYAAWKAAR